MIDEAWEETELLKVSDRNGNKGVVLLSFDDNIYLLPYELSKGIVNRQTGRAQPVICDFCKTWQSGSGAGSISFQKDKRSINSVGFLCCADLSCSKHVRNRTHAAAVSRSQLRESITDDKRIERLKNRLREIVEDLELNPVSL